MSHDCERNSSPIILIGNQMVQSWNYGNNFTRVLSKSSNTRQLQHTYRVALVSCHMLTTTFLCTCHGFPLTSPGQLGKYVGENKGTDSFLCPWRGEGWGVDDIVLTFIPHFLLLENWTVSQLNTVKVTRKNCKSQAMHFSFKIQDSIY